MYSYSLNNLKAARIIASAQRTDRYGKPLYPPTFITWANKVLQWFSRFYQVLRRYARLMKGAALAARAIWDNLKAGISLPKMLRLLNEARDRAHKHWQRNRATERGQVPAVNLINPKTNRTEYRAHNMRIANSLQTLNF